MTRLNHKRNKYDCIPYAISEIVYKFKICKIRGSILYIPGHLIIRISKKYYYTVSTNNNLFTSKNTAHSEI